MISEAGNNQVYTKDTYTLAISPKSIVFKLVFVIAFLASGMITMLTLTFFGFQFRLALVSLLVIPLFIYYPFRITRIELVYFYAVIIVLISGLINHSSVIQISLFLRSFLFSYLIYFLVNIYVTTKTYSRIISVSIFIGIIQLPIMLLQRFLYDSYPVAIRANLIYTDVGFGTFNYKGDPVMTLFLIMLIIYLLFDPKSPKNMRSNLALSLWFTLTIFLSGAEMSKLIVVIIWGLFLLMNYRFKQLILVLVGFVLIMGVMAETGYLERSWNNFSYSLSKGLGSSSAMEMRAFKSGEYGRNAAITYYLNQPLKLFGDGPSKYYNAITKKHSLGNTGHVFTYYSEIGLMGWLGSFALFFFLSFRKDNKKMRFTLAGLLSFLSIMLLSITHPVLNDISLIMAFCIFTKIFAFRHHELAL